MSGITSIYVTFANLQEAKKIIKILLEKKLIACANLFDNASSLYLWEGKLETSNEVIGFLKTQKKNFSIISDLITKHHSYDCPCILQLKIIGGNDVYLQWLKDNTI